MNELIFKNFTFELADGIAVFTLNRAEFRNSISNECWDEISRFFEYADTCDDIRVVILTGAGTNSFASGQDIKSFTKKRGIDGIRSLSREPLLKIENNYKPVIAAVNGYAFGGGCELALACDIRILASHAKVGFPEPNLGIIPAAGGTQRLSRLIGVGRSKEVILAGRILDADEAVNMGFAMKSVPIENLLDEAKEVAKVMLSKGPVALALAKKAINASMYTDINTGLILENFAFDVLLETEDKAEGAKAFLEKRKANFAGK
jgi:enoyl-CoA hydratase